MYREQRLFGTQATVVTQTPGCVWLCDPSERQHCRLPCPSPSPWACSYSCALSQWCHLTFLSCLLLLLLPSIFPSIKVFSSELAAKVLELQHQSLQCIFRLISFRIDWFDLLIVHRTLKSSPTPQFKSISSSAFTLLCLTSIHDYWKNWSFD